MKKLKNFFLKILVILLVICILITFFAITISNKVKTDTKDQISYIVTGQIDINQVCRADLKSFGADCALVLGAGIEDEETPSKMLRDRLDVAIELYKLGIVPKILLSGDNGQQSHNEIHVMLKYTKEAGVPEADIFCDHAGFSTYDSVYRTSGIFKASRIIIVTQEYHLYRALYIANKLGLEAIGVASDQKSYFGGTYRELREVLARDKDFFKAFFRSAASVGGQAIPISGNGISSHGE